MAKADRLLFLIEFVRTHPYASAKRINTACEVSVRTFYRDLIDLSSRSIHILFDEERQGYYLASKTYLQSLVFTEREALAIQMALRAKPLGNTFFGQAARSALTKIEAAMISDIELSAEAAAGSFVLEPTLLADYEGYEEIFDTLEKAWRAKRTVLVEYDSKSDPPGTPLERRIDVYGAFNHGPVWYIVSRCHYFDEPRTFKIKRIKRAELLKESYMVPADFSVESYVRESWQLLRGDPKVEVVAKFSSQLAHLVLEEIYHPTQEITELPDDSVVLKARVAGWREFGWWLLRYGDEVEVLAPPELRAELARLGRRFLEMYAATDSS